MARLNEGQFQPRMFDPGPTQDPTTYIHQSRGYPDEPDTGRLDPNVRRPLHMGTQAAAREAGGRNPGTMYAMRIKGEMANTPEVPVSDAMANALVTDHEGAGYRHSAYLEMFPGEKPTRPVRDLAQRQEYDQKISDWQSRNADNLGNRGLYYTNEAEDVGSISAVVPDMSHVEILGEQPYRESRYSGKFVPPLPVDESTKVQHPDPKLPLASPETENRGEWADMSAILGGGPLDPETGRGYRKR